MGLYLRAKFEVSSIILTSFRQGGWGNFTTCPPPTKRTPKKPTQIRVHTKEQTVLKSIKDAFEGKDMQTQYSVLGYRINLYFHKHKLAIEVDELGHAERNLSNEIERQKALQKELE